MIRWPWTREQALAVRPDMTRRRFLKLSAAVPVAAVAGQELLELLRPRSIISLPSMSASRLDIIKFGTHDITIVKGDFERYERYSHQTYILGFAILEQELKNGLYVEGRFDEAGSAQHRR